MRKAGESSGTVEVTVLDDEEEETLTLVLSNPSGDRLTGRRGDGNDRQLGPAAAGAAGAFRPAGGAARGAGWSARWRSAS